MSNLFTDKDTGFKELMTSFKANGFEMHGFAGFLRSSGEYAPKGSADGGGAKSGVSVAQVARMNEFGSGNIPERSFFRSSIDSHSKELEKLTKKLSIKVLLQEMPRKQALGLLCQRVVDIVRSAIDSNIPPANAPSTIARKGSDKTLVDTHQMLNSVDWEIRSGEQSGGQ